MFAFIALFCGRSLNAQAPAFIDRTGNGIADISPEIVLIILQEGVSPNESDELFFSRNRSMTDWAKRTSHDPFGRMISRVAAIEGVEAARHLTRRTASQRRAPGNAIRRHLMSVRIDTGKLSLTEALELLSADPDVFHAEPDFMERSEFNDPYASSSGSWGQNYPDQWYLSAISAQDAWSLVAQMTSQVVVAVIDSGVDRHHPDLTGVMWINSSEIPGNGIDDDENGYVDDVYGWNTASDNNNTLDTYGHGTLIAGLIAAKSGNGFGIAGTAPEVQVMALRNGEAGFSYVSRSIEALYYAANHGARVVNMSFGGANYSVAFAEAIRYALDKGVVLVASAGNAGQESYFHYPSAYRGVIAVGATDHENKVASFSNYGPAVDLVAPGGGGSNHLGRTILGPRASNTTLGSAVDAHHVRGSGTSYASPLVAAGAALLLRQNPTLAPLDIRQILCRSADAIGVPGWDLHSSYGRLNIAQALQLPTPPVAEISSLAHGQFLSGTVAVSGTARGPDFLAYQLQFGQGKTPTQWTDIAHGHHIVNGGALGSWATTGLPGGIYTLRLIVTASGRPHGEDRIIVTVGSKAPTPRPGWSISHINSETHTVMDMDNDGVKEVIVPTGVGVYSYTPNAQPFRAGTYSGILSWPSGPASVGDIDGDGELEIGTISKSGTSTHYPEFHEVRFWKLDGTTAPGWPVALVRDNDYVPHTLAPTVADVDGDGVCEIMFPSVTAKNGLPRLHLVRGNATPLPGWPKVLNSVAGAFIHCTIGVADLNGDGRLDFVVADSSGRVHALDQDGNYLPGWPRLVSPSFHIAQEIVLSDLDRDGRTDVIAAFYGGTVAVMERDGVMKPGWPRQLGGIPRPPAIADLDGDGDLELAIGTQDGILHVLHHDGTPLPGWPKQLTSRVYTPSLVDLNNDGKLDIVASDGARIVHAWNVEGTYHSSLGFPFQVPGTFGCYSPPVVEDLDGDGKLEVIVYGLRLEVYDLAAIANPQAPSFNHLHCDPGNACRYVLPGTLLKGQRFIADRAGGTELNLDGVGLLIGSAGRIGNKNAIVDVAAASSLTMLVPPGLATGYQDIWITHPNTTPTWLANSVLVVEDLYGDTDGDGLSDLWEWQHGFDPFSHDPDDPATGAHGDADGDGIPNMIEEAFALMGFDPRQSDGHLLPGPDSSSGQVEFSYFTHARSQVRLWLRWSPDLVQWFNPEDVGYPSGIEYLTQHESGETKFHRIVIPPSVGHVSFVSWAAERD